MAKEYNNRRSSKARNNASPQFLVLLITFFFGYLTASFLDVHKVSQWINTQLLAYHDVKKEVKPETRQAAIPPKPKFEFYTLLANEKVPNSQLATHSVQPTPTSNVSMAKAQVAPVNSVSVPVVVAQAVKPNSPKVMQRPNITVARKPEVNSSPALMASPASTARGNFLVQVASFRARQDAEQMKGRLILKGFDVYIIPVKHAAKGNLFRVVVGPYVNRGLAQQAQVTLARNERINGMITPGG